MNQAYLDTVRLLLQVAPHVFASARLGLKGGTALNLFVHDMPRLSVDIDVVFLDHTATREAALVAISGELARIKSTLARMELDVSIPANQNGEELKLVVATERAQVKVEVNQVFRGTVMPVRRRVLVAAAEEMFATQMELPVLAEPELYGGKLVAAFDRQHPRDWFDVLHLRRRGGLTPEAVACFVAYLAGHNRPVHEVLFPTVKAMASIYEGEFRGMTLDVVSLAELEATRDHVLAEVPRLLSDRERRFLLSLVRAEPRWELMPFPSLSVLPAVKWKLQNLERLRARNKQKFIEQHDLLEARLSTP